MKGGEIGAGGQVCDDGRSADRRIACNGEEAAHSQGTLEGGIICHGCTIGCGGGDERGGGGQIIGECGNGVGRGGTERGRTERGRAECECRVGCRQECCGRGGSKECGIVNKCAENSGRGFDTECGGFDGSRYILLGGSEGGLGWLALDEAHHHCRSNGCIGECTVWCGDLICIRTVSEKGSICCTNNNGVCVCATGGIAYDSMFCDCTCRCDVDEPLIGRARVDGDTWTTDIYRGWVHVRWIYTL